MYGIVIDHPAGKACLTTVILRSGTPATSFALDRKAALKFKRKSDAASLIGLLKDAPVRPYGGSPIPMRVERLTAAK